jgi:hypothetical protein
MTILRANRDARTLRSLGEGCNQRRGWADQEVRFEFECGVIPRDDFLELRDGAAEPMHFPVTRHQRPPHRRHSAPRS